MATQLSGNVYQVGGEGFTHSLDGASYLLLDESRGQHVLIDAGSPEGLPSLERQLASLGVALGSIAVVYGTHCHYDHIAGVAAMDGATLRLHRADHAAVLAADSDRTASFLYDKAFPRIATVEATDSGAPIAIGPTVLTPIHTPGHTPGSTSFKLQTREATILIAGDMLWGGYHPAIDSDLDAWENSFEILLSDHFDYVSFGHGVSRLLPDAMAHLAKARSHFRVALRPSHEGRYFNPWADPLECPAVA